MEENTLRVHSSDAGEKGTGKTAPTDYTQASDLAAGPAPVDPDAPSLSEAGDGLPGEALPPFDAADGGAGSMALPDGPDAGNTPAPADTAGKGTPVSSSAGTVGQSTSASAPADTAGHGTPVSSSAVAAGQDTPATVSAGTDAQTGPAAMTPEPDGPEVENTLARVRAGSPGKVQAGKNRAASYRDKILRHKRRQYRRGMILVALATLLLAGAVILWMRRGYTRAELHRIAVLTAEDSASYANLGGNVIQYGTAGALCIDRRGATVWNVSYDMQQPITSISGNVIAIADRDGYDVYVMDQKGIRSTIRTSLPIHSIAAGENGAVAVTMNDSRTAWVRLYNADGREIAYFIRSLYADGYPIAAAVSPDGETICLSSVQMTNAAVKSDISFFNFGRSGQKAQDHNVGKYNHLNEVLPYLHYIDGTTCVCVSDTQLYCYWNPLFRSSGSASVKLSETVQGVFCSESFVGLLFTDAKGNSQYRLDLYNKRGKAVGSVRFSMSYTDISIAGDKVYINNEQQCQIYSIGGRCLYQGTFGRTIRALIPGASLSDLLVVTAEEVDSVRLH